MTRIRTIGLLASVLLLGACAPARSPSTSDPGAAADDVRAVAEATSQAAGVPTVDSRLKHAPYAEVVVAAQSLPSVAKMVKRFPPGVAVRGEPDRESYARIDSHGVTAVSDEPLSTFSIDVDTASYANIRRMLNEGRLPPKDAVRVEEFINYFDYADPTPEPGQAPFRVSTMMAPTPWNAATKLLRIGIRAVDLPTAGLPPANLVFLVDVSGSMQHPDKLPLLKRSLKLLSRKMRADDRISLVVYAGAAGVALEPTAGDQVATIEAAIDALQAGGSTHGSAGIRLAYAKAREAFVPNGINRVILATDGDFNVGTVDHRALLDLVERERRDGIALTTLGFGSGNLNDRTMEQLADHGNGNYAYIDTLLEAQKVLVEQMGGTLSTVAKDVKVQVEFNPATVAEYRLIGYENRALRAEDFNNDRIDAGELGAGHSIVALYELSLVGDPGHRLPTLRYGGSDAAASDQPKSALHDDEFAFVKMRFKQPGAQASTGIDHVVDRSAYRPQTDAASDDFRFAAAVAAFAQRLRGGDFLGGFEYADVVKLARAGRGDDDHGYRAEFVRVVGLAESLDSRPTGEPARNDHDG